MWRQYRLCRLMRCTPLELAEQPGVLMDWFLKFEEMENRMQQDAAESQ